MNNNEWQDIQAIHMSIQSVDLHNIGIKMDRELRISCGLINIARGQIIKEEELIKALSSNMIGGAFLDVFKKEPLDQDSKLFSLNNVMLSPHISGNFPEYQKDMIIQFASNLNKYHANKSLINRVCKKRLY